MWKGLSTRWSRYTCYKYMKDEMIPKQKIPNDPIDQIWVWDSFFAYSLFFNKGVKSLNVSWKFSPILRKFQVRLRQPYWTCSSFALLLAESFFSTGYIVLLISRLQLEIMNESLSFGFGKWFHLVGYSLFFLLN